MVNNLTSGIAATSFKHNHPQHATSPPPAISINTSSPRIPNHSPISPPSANNSNSSNNSSVSGFPFSSTVISPRNSITSFSNPTKQLRANSINSDNGNNSNGRRTSNSNYSITSTPTTNNRYSFSEYSNEQIIDLMEREQDAIVLKLMKEIEFLKQENKMLRLTPGGNSATSGTYSPSNSMSSPSTPPVRRSSSLSSRRSSITTNNLNSTSFGAGINESSRMGNCGSGANNTAMSAPVFNYPFRDCSSTINSGCNFDEIRKKQKSEMTSSISIARKPSLNGRYEEIIDENRNLKRQLKKLQGELELLKKQ